MKPTQEQILSALNKLIKENKTELKAEKVELGYLQDVAKTAAAAVKKYDKSTDILKAWQSVKRLLTDANKDIMYVRKNRKAFIMGIEGQIEDINTEVKFITAKFKELGEDGSKSKELTTAKKAVYQLGNFLKDLKSIDDFDNIKI